MLPSGYKLLEYVESSGTQFVDTEFKHNQDTRVVMDVQPTSITANAWLFEGRNATGASGASKSVFFYYSSTKLWTSDYYGTGSRKSFSTISATDRMRIDYNKNVCTINGETVTHTSTTTFQSNYSLYLLADNRAGTTSGPTAAKLYACQIYDNGAPVRKYIPCINPDGEVGLYDLVGKKFYGNAGTGTFVAGPELHRVKYIQSSGTQYIKTRVKPNQNTRVVFKGYNLSTASSWIFGQWHSNGSVQYAANGQNAYSLRYGSASAQLGTLPVGEFQIDLNKNTYTYNGTTGTFAAQTFTASYDMYLFAINAAGSVSSGRYTGQLNECQIYDDGTLIRDYLPMADADGAGGLYDMVNYTFERDAAGGAFLAGPVVVDGLSAPDNLTVNTADGQISLAWDPVTDALFYTVLRDGFQIGNTTETSYTAPMVPFANSIYGVTAVNDKFESLPAEVLAQYIPVDYLLITDRTSADAQRAKYLRETGWAAMTEAERTEFLSQLKGAYNASDLNRVEYAAQQLANTLNSLPDEFRSYAAGKGVAWDNLFDVPYTPPNIETKYDWTAQDIPTTSDMERYLGNVTHLRSLLDYATAALPASMDKLTADDANAIEAALEGLFAAILALQEDRKSLIDNTAAAWFYSGEIYGGEV